MIGTYSWYRTCLPLHSPGNTPPRLLLKKIFLNRGSGKSPLGVSASQLRKPPQFRNSESNGSKKRETESDYEKARMHAVYIARRRVTWFSVLVESDYFI